MSILEVKNLSKSFGNTEVLKDISFTLEKGDVLSIIGSSGSGKTTILRCINQLETADSGYIAVDGEVFFDGRPIRMRMKSAKSSCLSALYFRISTFSRTTAYWIT